MSESTYVDNRKRGRILAFSVFVGLMLFVIRAWDLIDIRTDVGLLTLGLGYFLFSYLGQIVLFNFAVTRKSLITVIPQTSLFITMEALFVMVFFFNDFERLLEIVLLIGLLSVLIMSTYSSLLMSNVFNVSTFKSIPLTQVASTASYIVTVLTVYFVSFSVISSSSLNPIVIGLALLAIYTIILIFHYIHMDEMKFKEVLSLSFVTAFVAVFAVMSVFFMGPDHEISSLVPTSVVFAGVGLEMIVKKASNKQFMIIQYVLVIIIAFLINLFFNK